MKSKKLILIAFFVFFMGSFSIAQTYEYIGVAKCKTCHNTPTKGDQYKIWAASKHANAMKVLSATEAKNPKCTKCHSTAAGADPNLLTETITVEEGVSCESCHGPGSAYKTIPIMKDKDMAIKNGLKLPDEKTCKKCHNEESPNYKGFNYQEYFAKIAHLRPAAE